MNYKNDDVHHITNIRELLPPVALLERFPVSDAVAELVYETRHTIHEILTGKDDRLLVIIGPCSIHDTKVALEVR